MSNGMRVTASACSLRMGGIANPQLKGSSSFFALLRRGDPPIMIPNLTTLSKA